MNTPEEMPDSDDIYSLAPEPEQPRAREHDSFTVNGVSCKQCGYDLSGLQSTGVCPECGYLIERSLTEDLLEYSAPDYLATLHRGVFFVLTALIIKFLIMLIGVFSLFTISFSIGMSGGTGSIGNLALLVQVISLAELAAAVMLAVGWWLFSAPDPAFTGRSDGSTARKVVRVTTLIVAGVAIMSVPFRLAGVGAGASAGALDVVLMLSQLMSFVAWVTGFFAAMLYLRWLSPRLPDWRVFGRAKMLMWLGPILFTVGWLCIGIGPLIGLILYWNMLNWVRIDLKEIRWNLEHS